MRKKVNYHTHTYRCNHATGTEEDYVISAIKNNIICLGISDHSPYPDDRLNFRMMYSELLEYLSIIDKLKLKYKNKITIYKGLEIEFDPFSMDYYHYLLNDFKVDYLALGQHVFFHNGKFSGSFDLTSTDQYVSYANTIASAFETGFFKFLCHPDVIFINNLPWDENCEKACNIIIEAAQKHNMILELNASGFRKGLKDYCDGERYSYPHIAFWRKVSKTNIKVLVNSDCHAPEDVWDDNMDKAYVFARELGLNLVYDIF